MSHQLHASLTRILKADGSPVGVGFLARTVQKPHPKYFTLEKRLYSSGHHLLVE